MVSVGCLISSDVPLPSVVFVTGLIRAPAVEGTIIVSNHSSLSYSGVVGSRGEQSTVGD